MSEFLSPILEQGWYMSAIECIATATVYATCLAAGVLVVRSAVGRWLAPRYRHALWLLVAVRLLLPVAPESRFSLHRLWLDQLTQQAEMAPWPLAVDTAYAAPI